MDRLVGRAWFSIALFLAAGSPLHARPPARDEGRRAGITRIEITRVSPVPGTYGDRGVAYELASGLAFGTLDPRARANRGIVNLAKAPRNAQGLVEYNVEIALMRPAVPGTGNGKLIYSVVNRGNGVPAAGAAPDPADAGTGFWMSLGYTVLWSGWQGELWAGNPSTLKGHFPIATNGASPIVGESREEYIPDSGGNGGFPFTNGPTSFKGNLTYPTASLDRTAARLTVRQNETGPRTALNEFAFLDENTVQIAKARGFDEGAIYELVYPAKDPIVNGIGFASVRDLVSFLRSGGGEARETYTAALAYGVSQSGRFLRDGVYQGFNADLNGRRVFDGILPVIPGSRKTSLNIQFSQAGRFSRQHEDHTFPGDQFPFTYSTTYDPIAGRADGILRTCSSEEAEDDEDGSSGTCPKVAQVDSDSETWQARASLVVTDPAGRSLDQPENVRVYMVAGSPHGGGSPASAKTRGICKELNDPIPMTPYLRAILVALDAWVTEGTEPPPSAYPSLDDGTLVTIEEARKLYPSIPGAPYSVAALNRLAYLDHSEQPPLVGASYPVFVTRPGPDGNPQGGIVPPEISVPYATYAGRNLRAGNHAAGEACNLAGSYIPFPQTRAAGDARPSIADLYPGGQSQYSALRSAAVDALIEQRYVLERDRASLSAGTLGQP